MAEAPKTGGENKEQKKFEAKDPQVWDVLAYLKFLENKELWRAMVTNEKGSEEYKQIREKFEKSKVLLRKIEEEHLPKEYFGKEALEQDDPEAYLEVTYAGEDRVREKLNQLISEMPSRGVTMDDKETAMNSLQPENGQAEKVAPTPELTPEPTPVIPPPMPSQPPLPDSLKPTPVIPPPLPQPEPPSVVHTVPAPEHPPLPSAKEQPAVRQERSIESLVKIDKSVPVSPNAWMGTWDTYTGGKAPEGPESVKEIERYVKRVGDSQGRNTLAYAYAESLLKNARESSVRQQAEQTRDEVQAKENASRQAREDLAAEQSRKEDVFDEPKDKKVTKLEKEAEAREEELEETKKKASLGKRFADGVKNFFSKFKREKAKEEKAAEVAEKTETAEEKPEKRDDHAELNEFGWKPLKEKKAPAMRGNEEINEFGWVPEKKKEEKRIWNFIKERAKGTLTGGMWEFGRATGFGLKTRRVGIETKAQVELLKQETGLLLDPNEAWGEALEVDQKLEETAKEINKSGGKEGKIFPAKEARKMAVYLLSAEISDRNVETNKVNEQGMVDSALRKLEDKLKNKVVIGREYMKAHGGKMITPEQLQKVETRLRGELEKIRRGQVHKDLVNFGKLYRKSLDDKWWLRYVYGALEGIGVYAGWKYGPLFYAKYFGEKAAGAASEMVIKDTIWGEAKRMLIQNGVASPTNVQIQQVALEMAKESGVKVVSQTTGEVIWQQTAAGAAKDVALSKGFILKLGAAKKAVLAVKAVL